MRLLRFPGRLLDRADPRTTSWVKIKNSNYSQMKGGAEMFDQHRSFGPKRATRQERQA